MKGVINRISGPVVTAEGLANAKMYDVVKVGSQGLIGEIIKLEGGHAIIQVYEDTTGIRPGEPVENTGGQLSVILGPGLLGSIFDGIQRPLDKIREVSGDFIARGVAVDSLDRKKKWDFKPTVKKGQSVKGGDIIGEVQETSLITHRILVPIGIEGTIEKIDGGKFNITETVAVVKTREGKVELTLAQKWPVRIARPVISKLPPNVPLITGQRVVDTLFPVAKGGTAAVPGPFGSGKCVSGDTQVLLEDGNFVKIKHLYNTYKDLGIVETGDREEIIKPIRGVGLFSLNKSKIRKSNSTLLYKGMSNSLMRIKTRTGRSAEITPVHKLFQVTDTGEIKETMARDLKIGDFISSVRKYDVNNEDMEISVFKSNIKLLTGNGRGNVVRIPETMTPELAEFLGYYVSEGYIRGKGTIVFTNSEEALLERFLYLTNVIFGLTGKKDYQKNRTPNVLICSRTLVRMLETLLIGSVAKEKSIPATIIGSSNRTLSAFLASYYLGDGSYYDGNVELCTASNKLQLQLSYTLTRFGILHTLAKKQVNSETYYRIYIRGVENLKLFYDVISDGVNFTAHRKILSIMDYINSKKSAYTSIDIVPLSKNAIEKLYRAYSSYSTLEKEGIDIHNYIGNGEKMSKAIFSRFVASLSAKSGTQLMVQQISELAKNLEYIYCDEIVQIEEIHGPMEVYDVSVPDFGYNFVGGNGAILLHNTVIQQQLAKWSDSEIVVYVGCGERGNEMTEVLKQFPELKDPKSGKPLMDRTVLVANTSNMPVAAREASVYTGITIAEYYRDMGYNVALMADSTSRWAEALREISGRLEEMPGEEGYPAYLGRKIAEFYERTGRVNVLNGAVGSVTAVGAVSPAGGDTSEPVSQNTLRVTRVFWALDASLANRRHFPSINWLNSYSLYTDDLKKWYQDNVSKEWGELYADTMEILQKEAEINEIVQLVGYDALPEKEKMILDIAKVIREDYLQQSAYDEVDTYSSMKKQYMMIKAINMLYESEKNAVDKGILVDQLQGTDAKQKIARMKFVKEEQMEKYFNETKNAIGEIERITVEAK